MTADIVQEETVAQMTMTVVSAAPSPEAAERWARRAEVLAAWLTAEWRREQDQVQRAAFHEPSVN